MTTFHTWIVGAAWTLAAITLVAALSWALSDDHSSRLRVLLGSLTATIALALVARATNPLRDASFRFDQWCALAIFLAGLGVLWEYGADWDRKPFHFLIWVPVLVPLIRYAMALPDHIKSTINDAIVLLNQIPDTAKSAMVMGAVVLTFLAAFVKFVRSFAAKA